MKSFKELLKEKIKKEGYVDYSSLVSFAGEEGFKISTMDRRMRELCNEFPIEPIEKKSKRGSLYISGYKLKDIIMKTPNVGMSTIQPFQFSLEDLREIGKAVDNSTTYVNVASIKGRMYPIFATPKKEVHKETNQGLFK